MLGPENGNTSAMASTPTIHRTTGDASRVGTVVLWTLLVLAVVVGGMFLAVALTTSGDARTGGSMIAVPALLVAALCGLGLSRARRR